MRRIAAVPVLLLLSIGCQSERQCAPNEYQATQVRFAPPGAAAAAENDVSLSVPTRKLIRTVDLELRVDDPDTVAESVRRLTEETGGYVSEINAYRVEGLLHYSISIRVPVDELDAIMVRLKSLAVKVQREHLRTEDVTRQFVDLEAHLRTLQLTETELQALLSEARTRGSKADDIMTIYGYLTEIRTNIEKLQGQLNALANLAAYSTVNLELAPTEAARPLAGDAWRPLETARSSTRALVGALKGLIDLAIFLVIVVLPIGLVLGLAAWLAIKGLKRAWRRVRRG